MKAEDPPTGRLSESGNTFVPAILALEKLGYRVGFVAPDLISAQAGDLEFVASDPLALLGLIKLVEVRPSWTASDDEIEDVLKRFDLS